MFANSLQKFAVSYSLAWTLLKCKIEFLPMHISRCKCLHWAEHSRAEETQSRHMWQHKLMKRTDNSVEFSKVSLCLSAEVWWQHLSCLLALTGVGPEPPKGHEPLYSERILLLHCNASWHRKWENKSSKLATERSHSKKQWRRQRDRMTDIETFCNTHERLRGDTIQEPATHSSGGSHAHEQAQKGSLYLQSYEKEAGCAVIPAVWLHHVSWETELPVTPARCQRLGLAHHGPPCQRRGK